MTTIISSPVSFSPAQQRKLVEATKVAVENFYLEKLAKENPARYKVLAANKAVASAVEMFKRQKISDLLQSLVKYKMDESVAAFSKNVHTLADEVMKNLKRMK